MSIGSGQSSMAETQTLPPSDKDVLAKLMVAFSALPKVRF